MTDGTGLPIDIPARPRSGRPRGAGAVTALGIPAQGLDVELSVELPTYQRPMTGTDFQLFNSRAGNTAANTPFTFVNTFQLPSGSRGAIKSISILANALLLTSDIRWALLFNDVPVPGWNNLTINPRAAGSVEISWGPDECAIPIPEGATVGMRVRVLDGGTYQLGAQCGGWFYNSRIAEIAESAGW